MQILLCTDGSPSAIHAVDVGVLLAENTGAEVTLLGLVTDANQAAVTISLQRAQALLEKPAPEKVRQGRAANLILDEVTAHAYDLLVVGSRGRRGWQRLAFGSVAARLARYSPIPVLIIKGERVTFRRILACTSSDVRGERAARWGGQFAGWFNAHSTVLHVMSQIPFSPRSKLDELNETAEQAMYNHTREGKHLERASELMYEHGAPHPVTPKLRHGLVRDEIVAEVIEGDYDLVVLGGHQAPAFEGQSNIIRDYLLEDITDQILMAVDRPILIVKGN